MIQVREIYQIKFGKIDGAVEHFMRFPGSRASAGPYEVLIDLSGDMYSLVAALHVDSMRDWENAQESFAKGKDFQEWFRPFKQYVEGGHREFNRVEQANEGWSARGAIVVRSYFRALEWRMAETVELLKTYGAMLVDSKVGSRPRILTDASGAMFNTFIEIETPDLKTWDEHRANLFRDPQFQVWFLRLTACVSHGSHAFYTVAGLTARARS